MASVARRKLPVVVKSGQHFTPPPGTQVVSGTIRRGETELVLLVIDEDAVSEDAIAADFARDLPHEASTMARQVSG